jgi:hypothetical protein
MNHGLKMTPAVCCICGKIPAAADDGDWLEFQDYDAAGMGLSHPQGLEFFCGEHISRGRSFILCSAAEALTKIKEGLT